MSEHTYDVVVVGHGVAGLSAAVSARESGASVAVLERAVAGEAGGNTRYTEAYLRMASLDEPSEDLVDRLLGDFMGHPGPGIMREQAYATAKRSPLLRAHHTIDLEYIEAFTESAGDTLAWMTDHGMTFGHFPTLFLTTSTTRMAPVGGGLAIVETMGAKARELGVEFHYETTARELITDDAGRVTGVLAETAAGRARFTGTVILASGGFQGNAEMQARYFGPLGLTCRPVARGGNYNKGEGIEMGLSVGAATALNFALFHAEPVDPRSGEAEAAIMCFPNGILVNARGERFTDEARGPVDAWYERVTREIHSQPEGIAWVIMDAQGMAVPNVRTGIRTDQPSISAPTIEGLAEQLGLDAEALEATVSAYNSACTDGEFDHSQPDGLATQGLTPAKSNWARPLTEGPFEAWPIMAANVFTFGGLKTTASAEVVSRDGRAIPGLYAAGEMTGLYYSNYTGSTSVLRGAVFGRIAGREAAGGRGGGDS